MRRSGLHNRLVIIGTLLLFIMAQLFSLHLHFGHVAEHHDVHVHAGLFADHDFEFESVAHEHLAHGHSEEKSSDAMGWLGKKLSSFDFPFVISFVLSLALLVCATSRGYADSFHGWRQLAFFSPPLRAPPLSL